MKTFLIFIVSALAVCEARTQTRKPFLNFSLAGQVSGRDTGKIVLWYIDTTGGYVRDTAWLQMGKFFFSGYLKHPSYSHLFGSDFSGSETNGNYASFFLDGGPQTIALKENDFDHVTMTGSVSQRENDSIYSAINRLEEKIASLTKLEGNDSGGTLTAFNPDTKDSLDSVIQDLAGQIDGLRVNFIRQHPNSYVSATELLSHIGTFTIQQADSLYSGLSPAVRDSRTGKLCAVELAKKRTLKTGNAFPLFSAKDTKGGTVELARFKGKYLLVDFWASWCLPCRRATPHLKEVFGKYRSKRFDVLTISVDKRQEEWKRAIKHDGTGGWTNVLQDKKMETLFQAVQALPTQFLLDPDGIVIWSSLEDNEKEWADVLADKLGK